MQSMTGEEWKAVLALIPADEVVKFVLVLAGGNEICLDTIVRAEEKYLVVRGRLSGQVEDGRAFVVPLDKVSYLRWEKSVRIDELKGMFAGLATKAEPPVEIAVDTGPPEPADVPTAAVAPLQPMTEGALPINNASARNNLLERIRAARASTVR